MSELYKKILVEVGVSTSDIFTVSGKVRANEADGTVHQLEADRSTTLVAHHAQKTSGGCRGYE